MGETLPDALFNIDVPTATRLAPGVLGVTIVVRHQLRRFRFVVTPVAKAEAGDIVAELQLAIERSLDGDQSPVVEEAFVLLKSGSLPIPRSGASVSDLAAGLTQLRPRRRTAA